MDQNQNTRNKPNDASKKKRFAKETVPEINI